MVFSKKNWRFHLLLRREEHVAARLQCWISCAAWVVPGVLLVWEAQERARREAVRRVRCWVELGGYAAIAKLSGGSETGSS